MSLNVAANLIRMSAKDLDAFTKYVTYLIRSLINVLMYFLIKEICKGFAPTCIEIRFYPLYVLNP